MCIRDRLLAGPRARLGLADLHALADWSADLARAQAGAEEVRAERSIVDALDELPRPGWVSRHGRRLSPSGRERLAVLAGLLRRLRGQTYLPVADLVGEVERALGLDIEVAARPGRAFAAARAHLDAFRSVAAEFDSEDGGTLGGFLAWLAAAQQEERGFEVPVAEMDPTAVQLLTVHAAKGLEWDVVVVPGMVEGTFPVAARAGWVTDRGALPTALRGDRDHLPDLDLAGAPDLADVARRIAAFKAAHAEHHLDEERRLAYVAFTRARSHLLLAASRWRDGVRPTPLSGFLTEVVDAADRGEVPVQRLCWAPDPTEPGADGAEAAPVRPEPEAGPVAVWPADLLLDERRRREAERAGVTMPGHLAASAVVRLAADPDAFALQLRRPVPLPPSTQARRGTAFHAWVEAYYGAAALVDVQSLPGADDETVGDDPDLAELRAIFLASPWAARTPLAVEVDVETPVGGVVVRSRIDAVFAEPDGGVVVVDWKTGRPPTDPDVVRARELQLAAYRLAWSRRSGIPLDRVSAAFFYVTTGQTVRPSGSLEPDRIETALARAVSQTG